MRSLHYGEAREWLDAAREVMSEDLFPEVVTATHRDIAARFDHDDDERDGELVVAGALAAAYLAMRANDDADAGPLRAASDALACPTPLGDRLAVMRLIALHDEADRSPRRELATCLRTSGHEYLAACGHLIRAVTKDDPSTLRWAWIALCAKPALRFLADAASQREGLAAAAARPVTGHNKREVATWAGVSAPTLYKWIEQSGQPASPQ